MNSMRLRPPRPPGETGKPGEPNNRDVVHSGKGFCIREKSVSLRTVRYDPDFGFPSRAAKQGRGIELVPGGNQDPRLPEPQRDSCQR